MRAIREHGAGLGPLVYVESGRGGVCIGGGRSGDWEIEIGDFMYARSFTTSSRGWFGLATFGESVLSQRHPAIARDSCVTFVIVYSI